MNYTQFVTKLENDFFYELFNISYYGEIDGEDGNTPFPLRIMNVKRGKEYGQYYTRCSVFDYNELYSHYQEAKSYGWSLELTLLWSAIQLLNIVVKRIQDGKYSAELFDAEQLDLMKNRVNDYIECFKDLTGKNQF